LHGINDTRIGPFDSHVGSNIRYGTRFQFLLICVARILAVPVQTWSKLGGWR